MMDRGMIVDPDHLSVLARDQLMDVVEARDYSGIVSSHSWSSPDTYPRIYRLGGVVTPYAGGSEGFVKKWQDLRGQRTDKRFYCGFGYGADMNGFGSQGGPRGAEAENPVTYPFKSFVGDVTFDKQRSGERVYDINVDGVDHYGLYPDWIEDLRKLAGDEIVEDMARGAESYLQMWERAAGVPAMECRGAHMGFTSRGLGGVDLGAEPESVLREATQPIAARRAGVALVRRGQRDRQEPPRADRRGPHAEGAGRPRRRAPRARTSRRASTQRTREQAGEGRDAPVRQGRPRPARGEGLAGEARLRDQRQARQVRRAGKRPRRPQPRLAAPAPAARGS